MTVLQPPRRRCALVAPGSDARKAAKALASAADEVVLDLEDAVVPALKDAARSLVCDLARSAGSRTVAVRVNAPSTQWFEADLRACAQASSHVASVVVPKVDSVADLKEVDRVLRDSPLPVQALIETPAGVAHVGEIAAHPRVTAVIIGYADLGAALGRSRTAPGAAWLYVQDHVLHVARAAGIQAIDGPFLGTRDDESFREAVRWVADLGFDGKWAIYPDQIDTATSLFTPSAEQVDHARRVLDALSTAADRGSGAVRLDGQMLDEAVAVAARRTLAQIGIPA